MVDRLAAALRPESPVTELAGISSVRAAALSRLGIRTIRDLLAHYPHRYVDMADLRTIAAAPVGAQVTVVAQVHEAVLKRPKPKLDLVEVALVDGTSTLIATFFKQPWLAKSLKPGMRVSVAGTVEFSYGFKRMTMPFLDVLDDDDPGAGVVMPVHRGGRDMSPAAMRSAVSAALASCSGMYDPLPCSLRTRYRLMARQHALRAIHFPRCMAEQAAARRRLAYEEVLLLELHMMSAERDRLRALPVTVHASGGPCFDAVFAALPFSLTSDQMLAIEEIRADMASPAHMSRMVLGDVGTGKTAVAAFALALAADSGTQALMMAPTEVLVRQHADAMAPLFEAAGIAWDVLTSSCSAGERRRILADAASGRTCVLFGTQALLEDDVRLRACALVVVDEEQRFGVDQRACLLEKGANPDFLSLTATPIPRTLALALYGTMTASYLRSAPAGAGGRTTRVVGFRERGKAYDAALAACARGEQAYVVCPLVGRKRQEARIGGASSPRDADAADFDEGPSYIDSDADMAGDDPKAAEAEAAFLQAKTFSAYTVGLLHGRMRPDEKRAVMERFRAGEIDVLVSTTAIEVGVDIANATVMIVEDAERFGLSQLHQLRGRIGRGALPGEAYLVASTSDAGSIERLRAMERIEDGFDLAEFDLSLRGEGDVLGNRQHGARALKLVDVARDGALIEAAHADAARMLDADECSKRAETRLLLREADALFADSAARV